MKPHRALAVLCVFGALSVSVNARADAVSEAQNLVDEAEYDQAARVLRKALASGGLQKAELVDLYRLQGTVMVALGKRARAEAAFRNLILADPSYTMPRGVSPKVREVFDAVFSTLRTSGGLDETFKPQLTPVGSVQPGKDVALRLEIGDRTRAAQIQRVQFFYRRVGTPHYTPVDAVRGDDGGWVGTVPGFILDADPEDYTVEYYSEATDAADSRLTGVGTPTLPLVFEVLGTQADLGSGTGSGTAEEDDTTLWVTIGVVTGAVVVVGALVGIGAYVLLSQQGTGTATVTVTKN
ncbi:MAG: hypothetical protein ABIJ09_15595 [Pseudomonadota bacterium]